MQRVLACLKIGKNIEHVSSHVTDSFSFILERTSRQILNLVDLVHFLLKNINMPLYGRKVFNLLKPLTGVAQDEEVFTIEYTGEQFKSRRYNFCFHYVKIQDGGAHVF